jgi:hypothetical protein
MKVCVEFIDGLASVLDLPECLAHATCLITARPGCRKNVTVDYDRTSKGIVYFREREDSERNTRPRIARDNDL